MRGRRCSVECFAFAARERLYKDFVRVFYELLYFLVVQFAVEADAYPVLFVHMIGWSDIVVEGLQLADIVSCAPYGAEVEDIDIYEAEPLVGDAEYEQIAVVLRGGLPEWEFLGCSTERKTIFAKILDIHNSLIDNNIANI